MARFDVFRNTGPHAREVPFLLDVQSDFLVEMGTRVVVPLRRRDKFPAVAIPGDLAPILEVDGVECVMQTSLLAAVPARLLKKSVASLAADRQRIVAALDFLFEGI
jgi:toxin CcdB